MAEKYASKPPVRAAQVHRKTRETDIRLALNLDGEGVTKVSTGIGFFDHMLDLMARHGLMDLSVQATGDVHVDAHHTVEDIGICLGQAVSQALGERKGIYRYGSISLPMEEALANVSVDLGGRGVLVFHADFPTERAGEMEVQLFEEFFRAFSANAGMNLHVNVPYGKNSHHIAEGIFKALGKALDMAKLIDQRVKGVPSTKGII